MIHSDDNINTSITMVHLTHKKNHHSNIARFSDNGPPHRFPVQDITPYLVKSLL